MANVFLHIFQVLEKRVHTIITIYGHLKVMKREGGGIEKKEKKSNFFINGCALS